MINKGLSVLNLTAASVLLWIPKILILSVHNLKIRDNTSLLCCENEYVNDYKVFKLMVLEATELYVIYR